MSRSDQCPQRSTQHRVGTATGPCTPARKSHSHVCPRAARKASQEQTLPKALFPEHPTQEPGVGRSQYRTGTRERGHFRIVAMAPLALKGVRQDSNSPYPHPEAPLRADRVRHSSPLWSATFSPSELSVSWPGHQLQCVWRCVCVCVCVMSIQG